MDQTAALDDPDFALVMGLKWALFDRAVNSILDYHQSAEMEAQLKPYTVHPHAAETAKQVHDMKRELEVQIAYAPLPCTL